MDSSLIVSKGITLVPEGRRIFPDMTVLENLKIGAYLRKDDLTEDLNWVFDLFPRLKERSWQAGGTLSGGEQQMLAVGRALMSRPQGHHDGRAVSGTCAHHRQRRHFEIIKEINKQGVTVLLIGAERQHGAENRQSRLRHGDRAYHPPRQRRGCWQMKR